jgi:hypothetical protein
VNSFGYDVFIFIFLQFFAEETQILFINSVINPFNTRHSNYYFFSFEKGVQIYLISFLLYRHAMSSRALVQL